MKAEERPPDPTDLPGPALIYVGASVQSYHILSEFPEERLVGPRRGGSVC